MTTASSSDVLDQRLTEFRQLVSGPLPGTREEVVDFLRRHREDLVARGGELEDADVRFETSAAEITRFVDSVVSEMQRAIAARGRTDSSTCDAAAVTGAGMITAGAVVFDGPGALVGFAGGVGLLLLAC